LDKAGFLAGQPAGREGELKREKVAAALSNPVAKQCLETLQKHV
jgi:hypothetical protein